MSRGLSALLTAALAAGLVLVPSTGAWASDACTSYTTKRQSMSGDVVFARHVPSRGHETDQLSCYLRQGDRGPSVTALQEALAHCSDGQLTVDGIFGPATRTALAGLQRELGEDPDGIYGPRTRDAMTAYGRWPYHGPDGVRGSYYCGGWD